jgi:C4-dicarboxylate-specific signal transduction histidine kinase
MLAEAIPVEKTRDEIQRRQGSIVAMVQRARTITEHLRRFARREEEELGAVDLHEVLKGARLLAGNALLEHDVALTEELPEVLPLVWGNRVLLEQVLMNLLINARDAMKETPRERRQVRVVAEGHGEAVWLRVIDSGPGIPPEILPRLFEPFFTTKAAGQGTGLGLAICYGILKSCGGDITASNVATGGAEFRMTLQALGGDEE